MSDMQNSSWNRRNVLRVLVAVCALFGIEETLRRYWRKTQDEKNRLARRARDLRDQYFRPQAETPSPQPRSFQPGNEADYATFLKRYQFRYLSPREIIQPHYRHKNGVENTLPPEDLWVHLPPTLRVADEIRARLGKKLLYIASAYRSPNYNAQCPGAVRGSYHTKNMALDLVYDAPTQEVFDIAEQLREEGFFSGGIGLYNSFVHIDTRGRNATWKRV